MKTEEFLDKLSSDTTAAPEALRERVLAIPQQTPWWQSLLQPSWQVAAACTLVLSLGFLLGASPWQEEQGYEFETFVYEQDFSADYLTITEESDDV